jgi:hypothetical protein
MPKYLFILSPPASGSTLLHELICRSDAVSPNNTVGTREGQTLSDVRGMMYDVGDRWDPNLEIDWAFVKQAWHKIWNSKKPILLEKSPPNLMRAPDIANAFQPASFICLVRNPYACAERAKQQGDNLTTTAESLVVQLKKQQENLVRLENTLLLTYEEICDSTNEVLTRLSGFLPELGTLDASGEFKSPNLVGSALPITNLNDRKIANLNQRDLDMLNAVFEPNRAVLVHFGYELISRPL